jgi:hypothetical protein
VLIAALRAPSAAIWGVADMEVESQYRWALPTGDVEARALRRTPCAAAV